MEESESEKDCRLIAQTRNGDDDAFRRLFERYSPVVGAYLLGRVPTYANREELIQDVFITAYAKLPQLRDPSRFVPWLLTIARHKLYDTARKKKEFESHAARLRDSEERADALERIAAPANSPADQVSYAETEALVLACIGALKDAYRVPVYLHLIMGLDSQEIARQLNLRNGAVRVRIHRGLSTLREKIRESGLLG